MPNYGPDIGFGNLPSVPPPELGRRRFRVRPKRLLRKVAKGAIKIHTAPIKAVAKAGKKAMRAAARLAAKPIRKIFRKLATRRARLLSWKHRKSMVPNQGEKRRGALWALAKVAKKGVVGKLAVRILKFTKKKGAVAGFGISPVTAAKMLTAVPLSLATVKIVKEAATLGRYHEESETGLTGAEIAAAAAAIIAAIQQIMKSLNKPGLAPADPRVAPTEAQPEEAPASEGWGLAPP